MTVSSQAGTGEGSQLQLVSPLEEMLDAAVESERPLSALARRAKERANQRALEAQRPTRAAFAVEDGSDAAIAVSQRPSAPARRGTGPVVGPLGQRLPPEVSGWIQGSAVALGVVALLSAFLGPVSPTSPATAVLIAPPLRTPAALVEPARNLHGPGNEVAQGEPQPVAGDPQSRVSLLRPLDPQEGAAAGAALEAGARHPVAGSPSAARAAPSRPSSAPAAPRAQVRAQHGSAEKQTDIYTVDDMFGVGGSEPLPPEALDAPARAAPPPSRTSKHAHAAAVSSALFYQKLPF